MPNPEYTIAQVQDQAAGPLIRELQHCHPEYRRDLQDEYELWYDGGHKFREALAGDDGKFLCKRRADDEIISQTTNAMGRSMRQQTYRDLRKTRAQYTSEIGRIINSLVASAHKNPLRIAAEGNGADYYNSLNKDVDGAGTDASTQAARIMREGLLHRRSYLGVSFAGTALPGMDLEQALDAGVLDARLIQYRACCVIDWHRDDSCRLDMVRIQCCEDEYKYGTWGDVVAHVWHWYIIDDMNITEYMCRQEVQNGSMQPLDTSKPAVLVGSKPHGMKCCPVLEWEFGRDYWVADRLVEAQKKLFNSEADEAHIRSEAAHPQRWMAGMPIPATDSDGKVLATAVHGIVMEQGGSFHIDGPAADQAQWHFLAIEGERKNMYAAMEALYLGQSQQSQNARQAAEAKTIDREDSTLFIGFAAASLSELYERALRLVQDKRQDSAVITVAGMDKIDGKPLKDAIAEATSLAMVPRMPEEAIEYVVKRLAAKACQDAPQEVQDEIAEAELPPAPEPVKPASDGVPVAGKPMTGSGVAKSGKMESDE